MNWLDTETKALLQRSPPGKLAPADAATFALILLAYAVHDQNLLVRALQQIAETSEGRARRLLGGRLPACVKNSLSYTDAQIGQFELICRDAVSVIIADEVVANAPADYLADLYAKLRKIDEFELVIARIDSLPDSPSGHEFCNRFLSGRKPPPSFPVELMRKKARIMQHWATRIGGRMTLVPDSGKAG
jgi:hypothetical protein